LNREFIEVVSKRVVRREPVREEMAWDEEEVQSDKGRGAFSSLLT
jgi:hypothetical protein